MTKASDNPFPSVLLTEGGPPSAPASGYQRLWTNASNLNMITSAGVQRVIGGTSAGGITQSYLGTTSAGASWDNAAQRIVLKKVTLATAGLVAAIGAHIKGDGSHAGQTSVAILDDNSGTPQRVIARGPGGGGTVLTIGLSTTGRYVDHPIGAWLSAGDYWLGFQWMDSTDHGGVLLAYDGSGSDWTYATSNNELIWDHAFANYSSGSNNYSIRATILR